MPWHADAPDLPLHWTLTMTFPLLPGVASSCFCPPRLSVSLRLFLPPTYSDSYSSCFAMCLIASLNISQHVYLLSFLFLFLPPLHRSPLWQILSVPRQSDLTCLYITIQSMTPPIPSAYLDPKVCYWHGYSSQYPWNRQNVIISVEPVLTSSILNVQMRF